MTIYTIAVLYISQKEEDVGCFIGGPSMRWSAHIRNIYVDELTCHVHTWAANQIKL